jgi:hypothetical protein
LSLKKRWSLLDCAQNAMAIHGNGILDREAFSTTLSGFEVENASKRVIHEFTRMNTNI